MPISAENRWLYPIDWTQLSALIRFGRAKGRCQRCHLAHDAHEHRHRRWRNRFIKQALRDYFDPNLRQWP